MWMINHSFDFPGNDIIQAIRYLEFAVISSQKHTVCKRVLEQAMMEIIAKNKNYKKMAFLIGKAMFYSLSFNKFDQSRPYVMTAQECAKFFCVSTTECVEGNFSLLVLFCFLLIFLRLAIFALLLILRRHFGLSKDLSRFIGERVYAAREEGDWGTLDVEGIQQYRKAVMDAAKFKLYD
jgi:hypothetical protein